MTQNFFPELHITESLRNSSLSYIFKIDKNIYHINFHMNLQKSLLITEYKWKFCQCLSIYDKVSYSHINGISLIQKIKQSISVKYKVKNILKTNRT